MAEVKCYKCGAKYEENPKNKDMHPKQCPDGCKQKETKVEKNIKPKKLNKIEKSYKYPALEFFIAICTIFCGIAFLCSLVAFVYITSEETLLVNVLFLVVFWVLIILIYSYAELIRIFIRIEENTRK